MYIVLREVLRLPASV